MIRESHQRARGQSTNDDDATIYTERGIIHTRRYAHGGVSIQVRSLHTHMLIHSLLEHISSIPHSHAHTHTYIYISSSVQHESHSRIGGRGSSSFLSTPLPALSSDSMLTCPVYNPAGLVYCSGTLFAFLLPEFPIRGPPSLSHTHTDSSIHDDTRLRVSVFPPPVTVSLSLSLSLCVLLDFE